MKKLQPIIFDSQKDSIEKLALIFPSVVCDGVVDFELLRRELEGSIDESPEKYRFTWAGKAQSKRLAKEDVFGRTLRFVPEESKNAETTENLFIEGDNLEVLKLLRQNYYSAIKMIYIDPPYNTGNDFVYRDNFTQDQAESELEEGNITAEGERLVKNPKSQNRYHANWLNMIYPRLRIARDLLTDDGVIFISIDDNEVANLRKICDEIFGEANFVVQFPWRKRTAKSDVPFGISQDYEWIICYAKSEIFLAGIESGSRKYFETPDYPNRPWRIHDMTTQRTATERPNSNFTIIDPKNKKEYPVNPRAVWRVTKDTIVDFQKQGRIVYPGDYDFLNISSPVLRYFKDDDAKKDGAMFGYSSVSTNLPNEVGMSQNGTKLIAELFENKIFDYPKPIELIKYFLKISTLLNKDATILDFFAGSCTTAHAVMALNAEDGGNRRFIMVQIPEHCDEKSEASKAGYRTIAEIGKERIRRAGEKILPSCPSRLSAQLFDCAQRHNEHEEYKKETDIGFKVFKTDDTMIRWTHAMIHNDRSVMNESFQLQYSNKDGIDFMDYFTDVDVAYEILLRQHDIPLSAKMELLTGIGSRTWCFAESYVVCLEETITPELIEKLATIDPLPFKYIFRDSAFEDDISLKDETIRRLAALVARNTGETKKVYTVEFL